LAPAVTNPSPCRILAAVAVVALAACSSCRAPDPAPAALASATPTTVAAASPSSPTAPSAGASATPPVEAAAGAPPPTSATAGEAPPTLAAPTALDAGPSVLSSSCPDASATDIPLGALTRLAPRTRYRIAGTSHALCLLWSGYPLVQQPGGGHHHALAATIATDVAGQLAEYQLVGPQFFKLPGHEVRYAAAGPLHHVGAIDIGVTVTRAPASDAGSAPR
jgi:hypothetical protein